MQLPDRHFMKKLKNLDPKLGCEFNRNTEKFNITFDRVGRPAVVLFPVKSESGGFRQPDQRELTVLGESDLERVGMRDRLNKTSKYMADYRDKQAVDAKNNIRDMTKDGKIQLMNAIGRAGGGKHNSTFRRVKPKTKGKVFK